MKLRLLATELYELWRYHRAHRRHCDHWMVQKPGGPYCLLCGRAWAWKQMLPDYDD